MNSDVVAGTPLAAYLEENGLDEADWGIEDDTNEQEAFAPDPDTPVRGRARRRNHSNGMLLLSDESYHRRERFHALFASATNPRLPPPENNRFVERFRYIICTSQLLNEEISVSLYERRKGSEPLFGDQGPWPVLGESTSRGQYWIGGGGCVIVITLLLAWAVRQYEPSALGKGKSSAAFTISLMLALYLYGHTRRQRIRMARARAIAQVSHLVENCQAFDVAASHTLRFIQEVELVSRGFKITSPMAPITRMERNAENRRCQRLRTALISILKLAENAHRRANRQIHSLAIVSNLEKLHDIYGIEDHEEPDPDAAVGQDQSLGALKALFIHTHKLRRRFLCCLMAVDAGRDTCELSKWSQVVASINDICNLMDQLGRELDRLLSDDYEGMDVRDLLQPPISQRQPLRLRGLKNVVQSLRSVQAKMYVLGEDAQRIVESDDGDLRSSDVLQGYETIGEDLQALLGEWQRGRSLVLGAASQRTSTSSNPPSSPLSCATLPTFGSTAMSSLTEDINTPITEIASWDSPRTDSTAVEIFSEESMVYEGMSAVEKPPPRSSLPRERRIAERKEALRHAAALRKTVEGKQKMFTELRDVLATRTG